MLVMHSISSPPHPPYATLVHLTPTLGPTAKICRPASWVFLTSRLYKSNTPISLIGPRNAPYLTVWRMKCSTRSFVPEEISTLYRSSVWLVTRYQRHCLIYERTPNCQNKFCHISLSITVEWRVSISTTRCLLSNNSLPVVYALNS
jgi:hypothetical protein